MIVELRIKVAERMNLKMKLEVQDEIKMIQMCVKYGIEQDDLLFLL